MRSTWLIIHFCARDFSIFITYFHNIDDLFFTRYVSFCYISNENSSQFVLLDLHILLCCVKEISYLFHIDFHHADFDSKFNVLIRILNFGKDSSHHSRHDPLHLYVLDIRTLHCESLPRSCLSICKYRPIESFNDACGWKSSYFQWLVFLLPYRSLSDLHLYQRLSQM